MRLYKTQYSFRISGNRGYDSNRVRFMRGMKLIKAKWITMDILKNIGQCREDAPLRSSAHLLITKHMYGVKQDDMHQQ